MINAMVDDAVSGFYDRLDLTVDKGTRATADATATFLRRKGYTVSARAAKTAADTVAAEDARFHGATARQRVQRIGKEQISRVAGVLDASRGNARDREHLLEHGAAPVGGPRTPGGSMLKSLTRVLVGEAFRKAAEVDAAVMSVAGVGFAYRRLSADHEFLAKIEICEELNVDVYPGIRELLRAEGIDPGDVDLRGLYPINDLPDFPHPFCRCFLEPLV